MRFYFTTLFLVFSQFAFGQIDLGIGIVSIEFDSTTVLRFYKSYLDKDPSKTIEFFNDSYINSYNIRYLESHKEWLQPESLWLDYFSFDFRVKSQNENWFELIVNNQSGETLWLKKSRETKLSDWKTYLMDKFEIARLPSEFQKIQNEPNENSTEIKYNGQDCFQVKSMKGDWIEIFTPEHCQTDSSTKKIYSGWIKWKEGNKLLIKFFLTS